MTLLPGITGREVWVVQQRDVFPKYQLIGVYENQEAAKRVAKAVGGCWVEPKYIGGDDD